MAHLEVVKLMIAFLGYTQHTYHMILKPHQEIIRLTTWVMGLPEREILPIENVTWCSVRETTNPKPKSSRARVPCRRSSKEEPVQVTMFKGRAPLGRPPNSKAVWGLGSRA